MSKQHEGCGNCAHFVPWYQPIGKAYFDGEPDGVCTAPRPLLEVAPNREVKKSHGKNCPAWNAKVEGTGYEARHD
jgi:hypothetical protein